MESKVSLADLESKDLQESKEYLILILLKLSWILFEILAFSKLGWVHKNGGDHNVVVLTCLLYQRKVS